MLQLDITNTFNSISRHHIASQSALLPFFNSLYASSNTCFYRDPSLEWCSFSQFEGVTQGCSLSGMLACLGLHPVLQECHLTLSSLSPERPSLQLAYMDDVTSVLLPSEVPPYIHTFQQFGSPIGASLNFAKTTLLSTLDPITPNTHPALPSALSLLAPDSHLIHGTCLLGTPLGSPPSSHPCYSMLHLYFAGMSAASRKESPAYKYNSNCSVSVPNQHSPISSQLTSSEPSPPAPLTLTHPPSLFPLPLLPTSKPPPLPS